MYTTWARVVHLVGGGVAEANPDQTPPFKDGLLDPGFGAQGRALTYGSHSDLNTETLGVLDLPIGKDGRATQPFASDAAETLKELVGAQNLVPTRALVERQHVVGDHSEPD